MKKIFACFVSVMLLLSGCSTAPENPENNNENSDVVINLSDNGITVDGSEITSDSTEAVYSANDIVFYLEGQGFTYGEGTEKDEHAQSEADAHTVVHITKPGRYVLSGELSLGQIAVDLGENAKKDPEAVVTLVFNGASITCEVAPAVIFYNVYECGSDDEETATMEVDTSKAGANVVIADGTENNINGSYVARIYESYELSEDGTEVIDSEKLHKYDAAFYSKRTMNVTGGEKGDGILNINAENEGLDSELHLTINGGIINITSGNDGINTNEDNVSVTTINGGSLNIICNGATGEGDGIDSNGWLVINGGVVTAQACATSGDAGIDSDKGIYINGGKVLATGNMLDYIAGGEQTYAVFSFAERQNAGTYALKNADGEIAAEFAPENDFIYLIIAGDELLPGEYTFWLNDIQLSAGMMGGFRGGMQGGERPQMPGGEIPEGEMPKMPSGEQEPPKMPEGEQKPFDEMPGEERPEKTDGERPEMPEGEIPQIPDGEGNTPMPDNPFGNEMQSGESSTVFTIAKGANYFSGVGKAKEL